MTVAQKAQLGQKKRSWNQSKNHAGKRVAASEKNFNLSSGHGKDSDDVHSSALAASLSVKWVGP